MKIEFTQVKSDIYGNPRYVVHYLNFIVESDCCRLSCYDLAFERAKTLGFKKYTGKDYGGGFVIQSCNIQEDEKRINKLMESLS